MPDSITISEALFNAKCGRYTTFNGDNKQVLYGTNCSCCGVYFESVDWRCRCPGCREKIKSINLIWGIAGYYQNPIKNYGLVGTPSLSLGMDFLIEGAIEAAETARLVGVKPLKI